MKNMGKSVVGATGITAWSVEKDEEEEEGML